MQRLVILPSLMLLFLSGCYQSTLSPMMVAGPAAGAAQGRVISSAVSTGVNYSVKHKTGKFPIEHMLKREKDRIVKRVELIEKEVKKNSELIKNKVIISSDKSVNRNKSVKHISML